MNYQYKKSKPPVELSVLEGCGDKVIDFNTHSISVPCQAACPALTDVPGYIELISKGKFQEAYELNLEDNVMPGVLGRICVRPCQKDCRHNWSDINGPVEICRLKRSAADRASVPLTPPKSWFQASGKKVAVIGGGPAGLAAARELKRMGHDVTIFEKEKQLGGMLVDGIPRFRLPLAVIEEEIKYITTTGIDVKTSCNIDKKALEEIINEYQAVLLATGTVKPNNIDIEGNEDGMSITGLEFMKNYNQGQIKSLKGDVVIIGGGFTAVDSARACARTAKKLLGGNGNVTIVYRRTEEFLAADVEELEEINKENIKIMTLLSPISVKTKNGKLIGVKFSKNYIKRDEGGKGEIVPIENAEIDLKCSHLIIAIGQKQDFSILPQGISLIEKFKTTNSKLYTAGDFQNGSLNVITSIADGKQVARLIDKALMGEERLVETIKIERWHENGETGRQRPHDLQLPPVVSNIALESRIPDNKEVENVYDDSETLTHSTRCYLCHYKFEIDQDKCIQCKWCIDVTPRNCISSIASFEYDENGVILNAKPANTLEEGSFVWINNKNCIRCGKCLRVCPTSAISMKKTSRVCGKK